MSPCELGDFSPPLLGLNDAASVINASDADFSRTLPSKTLVRPADGSKLQTLLLTIATTQYLVLRVFSIAPRELTTADDEGLTANITTKVG